MVTGNVKLSYTMVNDNVNKKEMITLRKVNKTAMTGPISLTWVQMYLSMEVTSDPPGNINYNPVECQVGRDLL